MKKEEIKCLKLFCDQVKELESSRAMNSVRENSRIRLSIRIENGQSVEYNKNFPADEDIEKFTRLIRQFLMDGEYVNFQYITNILIKSSIDSENIKKLKGVWNEILNPKQKQVAITYKGIPLSNKELIGIFLYGGYIHAKDDDLINKYKGLKNTMGDLFDFWIFNIMLDLASVVIKTKTIIEKNHLFNETTP
ncbi:hypothetical protein KKA50_00685 [Patescibacteria group bacterium]|nr:hypothetical protein [Patescibacteria group bacterium]